MDNKEYSNKSDSNKVKSALDVIKKSIGQAKWMEIFDMSIPRMSKTIYGYSDGYVNFQLRYKDWLSHFETKETYVDEQYGNDEEKAIELQWVHIWVKVATIDDLLNVLGDAHRGIFASIEHNDEAFEEDEWPLEIVLRCHQNPLYLTVYRDKDDDQSED